MRLTRRRVAWFAAAVAIGVVLGLAIDVLRVGGIGAWLAAREPAAPAAGGPPIPPYEERGRLVEVDGRNVYLDCRGSGTPTVILESGMGEHAGSWGGLLDGLAGETRVCAWDRPGLGRSESMPLHSAADTAAVLVAALRAAGERGPFVALGFSLGGVYGRLFAEAADVAALIQIDTFEPDLWDRDDPTLDPDVRETIARNLETTGAAIQMGESLDWARTLAELAAAGPVEQPTLILTIEPEIRLTDADPRRQAAIVAAWHAGIERRYPNGTVVIVPGAGHHVHLDRPALVLERAVELIREVRADREGPAGS